MAYKLYARILNSRLKVTEDNLLTNKGEEKQMDFKTGRKTSDLVSDITPNYRKIKNLINKCI